MMEKSRMEILGQINAMKQMLANTDYVAIKFAEGEIDGEDYAPVQVDRRRWRAVINELEGALEEVE